jgi:hypothetical protein
MRDSEILKLVFGGGADDRFEIDDPVHGRVIRPSRLPAVGPSGCLRPLAVTLPTVENGRTECVRLWRDSERFMEACRPAIDAIASALLASGRLSYDEVAKLAAAAMKDSPDPAIPWWAPRPGAPRPPDAPSASS